jgi:hypothetical protein
MNNGSVYGNRFIGNQPELLPGQSAFGWVARLARLNQLRPEDLHHMFGLRVRRSHDLLRVLALSERAKKALAVSLMHESSDWWNPKFWYPFTGGPPDLGLGSFRYCLGCIRVGYHSMLHQMQWISACPWHGIRLRTGCPRCDGPIAVSGDAGRKLLSCGCGFDLLDESAAARLAEPPDGAADAVARYSCLASTARNEWMLVGLDNISLTPAMLVALVPSALKFQQLKDVQHAERCHTRTYRGGCRNDARTSSMWPEGISHDCPQVMELPDAWAKSVHAVARNLACKLPSGSLTPQEQLLFLGGQVSSLDKFSPADRGTSGTVRCLPPITAGLLKFLDLSSVHPAVVRTMAELARSFGSMEKGAPSEEASFGATLAHKIAGALLCRGYAEGLRAVLSRYVPALYELPRDRPHLSAAWMLVSRRSHEIRVAFARIDPRQAPLDALTSAYINS